MRLLILGGTLNLGRHIVEAARQRGHEVTLFNRGQTRPELFPDLERLRGDRGGDLAVLRGRRWDAAIDTCGYLPHEVRASTDILREAVDHLGFVSSISAYADRTRPGLVETDVLQELPAGTAEELSGDTHGALRDAAAWMVRIAETRTAGIFNTTGPDRTLTMGEFLDTCRAVAGSDARLTWAGEEFLIEESVAAYSELPLWVPEAYHAFQTVNCSKAFATGLAFRPLADTVRDTLAWARSALERPAPKPGVMIPPALAPAREAELLARWNARQPVRD